MDKIRLWLQGKKTYLTAAVGVIGAVLAWANGQIDLMALVAAVWAAVSMVCLKAGQETSATKAITKAVDDGTLRGT
jgi:hypothetical protein